MLTRAFFPNLLSILFKKGLNEKAKRVFKKANRLIERLDDEKLESELSKISEKFN